MIHEFMNESQPISTNFPFTALVHNGSLHEKVFYLDLNCPPEITVNKREDKKHNKDNKYEKQSMFQECTLILK